MEKITAKALSIYYVSDLSAGIAVGDHLAIALFAVTMIAAIAIAIVKPQ